MKLDPIQAEAVMQAIEGLVTVTPLTIAEHTTYGVQVGGLYLDISAFDEVRCQKIAAELREALITSIISNNIRLLKPEDGILQRKRELSQTVQELKAKRKETKP